MIKLRPHHLLCIFGWKGRGYDEAFEENFNKVVALLDRKTVIQIVAGVDDICEHCPHLRPPDCLRLEPGSSHAIDDRVLAKTGININDRLNYGAIVKTMTERIKPEDIEKICNGCSWEPLGWCKEGLEKARATYS
ncbi:MAG: DUF1284 domain-containing protein [Actinomycetia bacterium]|nr:DUF1284 domain-containing protein [Actinomycetes bacterium]